MQINFNTKSNTFSSTPIYPIKLKQLGNRGYNLVDGYFSELSPCNKTDIETMYKVYDEWNAPKYFTDYAKTIATNFQSPSPLVKYYATELKEGVSDLYGRLTSLLELTNPKSKEKDAFEVLYLQASPNILFNQNPPPIKGAGALGMYGAVKLARDNNFEKVKIISSNNQFYENLGIPKASGKSTRYGFYELPADKYDHFLSRIAEKYSLPESTSLLTATKGRT